jgi:hypothetical protein
MKRMLALTVAWSALALSIAGAVPARPLYEPPAAAAPPVMLNLAGTTWQGKLLSGNEVQIVFEPNGVLIYRTPKNIAAKGSPGSWTLIGNQIVFDINKFSEHRGIVNGDVMEGDSSNKNGLRGTFRLQRFSPGK